MSQKEFDVLYESIFDRELQKLEEEAKQPRIKSQFRKETQIWKT